jgi:hypothetical protein
MFGLLIVLLCVGIAGLGTTMIVTKLMNGHIPRPLFELLMASWWPYKDEDTATLVADAIDQDVECKKWKTEYSSARLESLDRRFSVRLDAFDTRAQVTVRTPSSYGHTIVASPWGDHRLYTAVNAWVDRRTKVTLAEAEKLTEEALEVARSGLKAKTSVRH